MKEKRATEKLNVALAGIDSCLSLMESQSGNSILIAKAREFADEAYEHLRTIRAHAAKI